MGRVPRELFVPVDYRHLAYEDIALPIGCGQTISQPMVVALMTQALRLGGPERVLEIGTGSGYQAAVLAELVQAGGRVVSIERQPALAERAARLLAHLGYTNVEVHTADGSQGWPPGAPYNAALVTAGAPDIPQALVAQLEEGGRLVIPLGSLRHQGLWVFEKRGEQLQDHYLGQVRFVPLIGTQGWPAAQVEGE